MTLKVILSGVEGFFILFIKMHFKKFLNCSGRLLDLSTPKVMGILNITDDSFYDGGQYTDKRKMLLHAEEMIKQGAAIIDIGGQSTRPGSTRIDAKTETERVIPVLKNLKKNFPEAIFSVDTYHAAVAEAAINEGASIINDISGGTLDEKMFEVIARYNVPYILMHMQGTPETMQKSPSYKNITEEVMNYFSEKISALRSLGINDIILDPGFGFGKTLEHNYTLLSNLELFRMFELPILCGLSRKSMVGKLLNVSAAGSLNGTTALNTIALMKGANILRVHDVKEAVEVIKVVTSLHTSSPNSELPTTN
ncbi:MAG TPA: dihydropteroate synthase [Bacteroidia bacterium]|nr:dihydropteroate synthase [Bacteroidia bacterium]